MGGGPAPAVCAEHLAMEFQTNKFLPGRNLPRLLWGGSHCSGLSAQSPRPLINLYHTMKPEALLFPLQDLFKKKKGKKSRIFLNFCPALFSECLFLLI